jgi:hypothetical protein
VIVMVGKLRRIGTTILVLVGGPAIAVALPAQPAAAATITIDSCSNTGFDGLLLYNAILEANDETTHPGPDTIQTSCGYHFGAPYPGTSYVLPPITGDLTIVGGSYSVYSQDLRDRFGIVDVPAGVSVAMHNVVMSTTVGQSDGSYVHNAGDFDLVDSTLAGGGTDVNGPALNNVDGGLMHVTGSTINGISDVTRRGAIENDGYLYLSGSTLQDNNRSAIASLSTSPAIRNSGYLEIDSSSIRQSDPAPGQTVWTQGISNTGDVVARNTEFRGHVALRGAAIQSFGGQLTIERSSFVDNAAHLVSGVGGGDGGAIFTEATGNITNSVFWQNSADLDGGAVWNGSWTAVHYSTFAANTARHGADLANGIGTMSVATSILASCEGTVLDNGANLVTVAGTCPGTLGAPQLQFRTFAGVRGIVAKLQAGSDAIDGVVNGNCPAVDQRNLPRPAGGACDIGAFENQLPTAPTTLALRNGSNPSNTGEVTLDWTGSTDADFDPVSYRLYGQDANDGAETLLATLTFPTGTPIAAPLTLPEGTYNLRVESYDGIHPSASSATLAGLVVDRTAPSAPVASADRAPDFIAGDGTGWYGDHVTVTFSSTDPLLGDGSTPSGLAFVTAPQTLTTSGAHPLTGDANDKAGNSATQASATYYVDADPPTVGFASCPSTVLLHSVTTLGWTAADPHSGLATPASGSVPVDTSTVGARTLTAGATDNVGHAATTTCTVQVIYDFSGFAKPVANPPTVNKVSAGNAVTITFSLHGDQGLSIFTAGYPVSAPITCGTNPQLTTGEPTNVIPPGLIYAASPTGRYSYAWKTSASWAGTCRQFVLRLNDGTYHRANFAFK